MSSCADGKEMFIEVHETCLTDFLNDINSCVKIMGKEEEFYIVKIFIMKKLENPICSEDKENNNE